MNPFLRFLSDEHASTAVEYAVMLGLILLVVIGSIVTVGQGTGGMWSGNNSAMQSAGFGS
jgi:Flp pilus assembly pilin Flp